MGTMRTQFPGPSNARSALIFLRSAGIHEGELVSIMATIVATTFSTNEKLLRAREASARLAQLSTAQKNAILMVMASALEANSESIIEANRKDLESSGLAGPMRDRLLLDAGRIRLMAAGVRDVAKLPDPTFETLAEWLRP